MSRETLLNKREMFRISSFPLLKCASKNMSHILRTTDREISGWELSTFARFRSAPVIYTKIIAFLFELTVGIFKRFSIQPANTGISLA